jgi:RPA family protein
MIKIREFTRHAVCMPNFFPDSAQYTRAAHAHAYVEVVGKPATHTAEHSILSAAP